MKECCHPIDTKIKTNHIKLKIIDLVMCEVSKTSDSNRFYYQKFIARTNRLESSLKRSGNINFN